jgi:hypothetical protein
MSEPIKVWTVGYGDYSDYGVTCVFTTVKLANEYAGNDGRVEELLLFDRQPVKFDTYQISGNVDPNGFVWSWGTNPGQQPPVIRHTVMDETGLKKPGFHTVHVGKRSKMTKDDGFFIHVEGCDEEAVKRDFEAALANCRASLQFRALVQP